MRFGVFRDIETLSKPTKTRNLRGIEDLFICLEVFQVSKPGTLLKSEVPRDIVLFLGEYMFRNLANWTNTTLFFKFLEVEGSLGPEGLEA